MSNKPDIESESGYISPTIVNHLKGLSRGPTYLEEAEFGLRRIFPILSELPAGARVLEVGSGPCILLAETTHRFPHLTIQGVEPMGDGFNFFDEFISRILPSSLRADIYKGGYEDLPRNGDWDLIFLVNVFEHLPDWRDFICFVFDALSPGGKCIILSPNYGFPYESHFRFPVIINKTITGKVFRSKIIHLEGLNSNYGLFSSLNFVKLAQVRHAVKDVGLELSFDTSVVYEMVRRLSSDPAFRARQGRLAWPANAFMKLDLFKSLINFKIVQNVLPYMQLVLEKRKESAD